MRIGGQPGHEVRAQAKDVQTGADVELVQWLRFGTGAYLRILGFAPKEKWPRHVHALPRGARRAGAAYNSYSVGLSLADEEAAGVAFAPPLATATSAGRSTRSPIR